MLMAKVLSSSSLSHSLIIWVFRDLQFYAVSVPYFPRRLYTPAVLYSVATGARALVSQPCSTLLPNMQANGSKLRRVYPVHAENKVQIAIFASRITKPTYI